MLILQTAFDPEFTAVKAAGVRGRVAAEAEIVVAGHLCSVLMTGMGPQAARKSMSALLDRIGEPDLVLSIGIAGGLRSDLGFGEPFLIERVQARGLEEAGTPPHLAASLERLSSNLRNRMRVCNLVTLTRPALTVAAKEELARQTDASLCDMETYAVADECRRRRLPWIGARIVSDGASDSIPAWITSLPELMEQKRFARLIGRVATHPQDLPSLIRLAMRMHQLKPKLTQLTIDLVTHVLPA